MPAGVKERKELSPLDIRCTRSECESDLHCFKKTRKMTPDQIGQCRSCGAQLVDWERVQQRDIADAAFTFAALKSEWIRHHFWHKEIEEGAELHARRKGRTRLRATAEKQLRRAVGSAQPFRDGQQTTMKGGNIIHYAQHALACCCRTCLEYWHGIPKGTELTHEQLDYFTDLVMMYVDDRMPALTTDGEKIPPRRKQRVAAAGDARKGSGNGAADYRD